ncbi:MAG: hypothetical protein V3R90_07005, partial [Limibaculum sp.]
MLSKITSLAHCDAVGRGHPLHHELPFAVTRNQVCNAAMIRHSALSVGNAAIIGPRSGGRRTSVSCHEATFRQTPRVLETIVPMDRNCSPHYLRLPSFLSSPRRRLPATLAAIARVETLDRTFSWCSA